MPTLSFSVSVIRPQDLLVLTFDFRNVDFTPPVGSTPGQIAGQAGAILVAHFQPQHIAEQAFYRHRDGELGRGLVGVQRGEQPRAARAEDQDVATELAHERVRRASP